MTRVVREDISPLIGRESLLISAGNGKAEWRNIKKILPNLVTIEEYNEKLRPLQMNILYSLSFQNSIGFLFGTMVDKGEFDTDHRFDTNGLVVVTSHEKTMKVYDSEFNLVAEREFDTDILDFKIMGDEIVVVIQGDELDPDEIHLLDENLDPVRTESKIDDTPAFLRLLKTDDIYIVENDGVHNTFYPARSKPTVPHQVDPDYDIHYIDVKGNMVYVEDNKIYMNTVLTYTGTDIQVLKFEDGSVPYLSFQDDGVEKSIMISFDQTSHSMVTNTELKTKTIDNIKFTISGDTLKLYDGRTYGNNRYVSEKVMDIDIIDVFTLNGCLAVRTVDGAVTRFRKIPVLLKGV